MTTSSILAHPEAPLGLVSTLSVYSASTFPPGSAVLCRTTSPLISHAYALLRRGRAASVRGRDIGAQLLGIVKKQKALSIPDLLEKLAHWKWKEYDRLVAENRSPEGLLDQCASIAFLAENCDSMDALFSKIDSLFSDKISPDTVLLSTIHRAKGLEWRTVFLLDRNLIPSRYATQEWQKLQERNLLYVAITRSQENLFYIQSNCWEKESPSK